MKGCESAAPFRSPNHALKVINLQSQKLVIFCLKVSFFLQLVKYIWGFYQKSLLLE